MTIIVCNQYWFVVAVVSLFFLSIISPFAALLHSHPFTNAHVHEYTLRTHTTTADNLGGGSTNNNNIVAGANANARTYIRTRTHIACTHALTYTVHSRTGTVNNTVPPPATRVPYRLRHHSDSGFNSITYSSTY